MLPDLPQGPALRRLGVSVPVRDQLLFSIGFAVSRNRDLLRRLLKEHITDATREQLAKRVVEHLELSGFEIDEDQQIIRKRAGHRRS